MGDPDISSVFFATLVLAFIDMGGMSRHRMKWNEMGMELGEEKGLGKGVRVHAIASHYILSIHFLPKGYSFSSFFCCCSLWAEDFIGSW